MTDVEHSAEDQLENAPIAPKQDLSETVYDQGQDRGKGHEQASPPGNRTNRRIFLGLIALLAVFLAVLVAMNQRTP